MVRIYYALSSDIINLGLVYSAVIFPHFLLIHTLFDDLAFVYHNPLIASDVLTSAMVETLSSSTSPSSARSNQIDLRSIS